MELDALYRELAMAQRHNFAVVALGSDLETCGKRTSLDHQRMISARLKRRRQIGKECAAVMPDHR